jgi:hypothetical protein
LRFMLFRAACGNASPHKGTHSEGEKDVPKFLPPAMPTARFATG